jgi:hypothetical protein
MPANGQSRVCGFDVSGCDAALRILVETVTAKICLCDFSGGDYAVNINKSIKFERFNKTISDTGRPPV